MLIRVQQKKLGIYGGRCSKFVNEILCKCYRYVLICNGIHSTTLVVVYSFGSKKWSFGSKKWILDQKSGVWIKKVDFGSKKWSMDQIFHVIRQGKGGVKSKNDDQGGVKLDRIPFGIKY